MFNLKHFSLNYIKKFVDSETGTRAHNQNVESMWNVFKGRNKLRRGTERGMIDSNLCEFIWRHRYSEVIISLNSWNSNIISLKNRNYISFAHFLFLRNTLICIVLIKFGNKTRFLTAWDPFELDRRKITLNADNLKENIFTKNCCHNWILRIK